MSVCFDWREACLLSWCNRKHEGRISQRYRFESRRGEWALFSLMPSALSFVFLWHTHTHTHTHTRGVIRSTMGAYPRGTSSNPVSGNGHFFPSYRQLYLSSFSDTHTHTHWCDSSISSSSLPISSATSARIRTSCWSISRFFWRSSSRRTFTSVWRRCNEENRNQNKTKQKNASHSAGRHWFLYRHPGEFPGNKKSFPIPQFHWCFFAQRSLFFGSSIMYF